MREEAKLLINLISKVMKSETTLCGNDDRNDVFVQIDQKSDVWNALCVLADRHNLNSILVESMNNEHVHLSKKVSNMLMRKVALSIMQDAAQTEEAEELMNTFENEKIPVIMLKGWVMKKLYPKSYLRSMADIDIYMDNENQYRVHDIMLSRGYKCVSFSHKKDNVYQKPRFLTIEMHKNLFQYEDDWNDFFKEIWNRVEKISNYNYIYQMDKELYYVYMIAHTAKHLIDDGGIGIRAFLDIWVYRKHYENELNYGKIRSDLRRLGLERFENCAVNLSKIWFEQESNADPMYEQMGDYIFQCGAYGNKEFFVINNSAMGENTSRFNYLFRRAFPSKKEMAVRFPIIKDKPYLVVYFWIYRLYKHGWGRQKEVKAEINSTKNVDMVKRHKIKELYQQIGLERQKEISEETEIFLQMLRCILHENLSEKILKSDSSIDWNKLEEIAKEHHLFAFFHEVASRYPEYKRRLNYEKNTDICLNMVAQQIKKTASFLDLYRTFLMEDIHPIVMKGLICRQLYGENAEKRPSSDEDILVKKSDFFKVKEIMERKGFVCSRADVTYAQLEQLQDVGFYEKKTNFLIEVHTNIMGHINENRTQMGEAFKDVFEHTREQVIQGVPITTMSHTEHFAFLVLHAFKHFSLSGVGVRQMLDILLYQTNYEQEIDWATVEQVLEANHALRYLGDLQYIGEKYLGFELSVHFEPCAPIELLEDMMEVGVFGKQKADDLLAARINLNTLNRKKKGIGYWLRIAFPDRDYMMNAQPYLKEKPWLLPVEWLKRWFRFLKKSKQYKGNLMVDGVKKSQKRRELLEKYGL